MHNNNTRMIIYWTINELAAHKLLGSSLNQPVKCIWEQEAYAETENRIRIMSFSNSNPKFEARIWAALNCPHIKHVDESERHALSIIKMSKYACQKGEVLLELSYVTNLKYFPTSLPWLNYSVNHRWRRTIYANEALISRLCRRLDSR